MFINVNHMYNVYVLAKPGPGFSKHLKSITMVTCLSSKFPYKNTILCLTCIGIYIYLC